VGSIIFLMVDAGQAEEAVRFFEERWDSLDAFVVDYPPLGRGDTSTLLDIAWAYGKVGNLDRYDEAMAHSRTALNQIRELGFKWPFIHMMEAVYLTMEGERERSLEHIAAAVEEGLIIGSGLTTISPVLRVFNGDPEFEVIQARMFEHLNRERAELGLEPVET